MTAFSWISLLVFITWMKALDDKQLRRVAVKGMKKVHGLASGSKANITIAAGAVISPIVIFKEE